MAYVVLRCGSASRGDTNPNSDVDWVCIWRDGAPNYNEISERYCGVMFYSAETIRRMMRRGALFIVHLDLEGQYFEGDSSIMDIYRGYIPSAVSLGQSVAETSSFILGLNWFPTGRLGWFWLLDVLYVSLRNYIFCSNALNKTYRFGFVDALTAFGLSEKHIKVLLKVREGKYAFRKEGCVEDIELSLPQVEDVCSVVLKGNIEFHTGGRTNWNEVLAPYYWRERMVERAIINCEHDDEMFLKMMKVHNYAKSDLKAAADRIISLKQSASLSW